MQVGQMTGTQSLIAILGLGLIFGGTLIAKYYLQHRSELHQHRKVLDFQLQMSDKETERMAIISNQKQDSPLLEQALSAPALMNKLEAADQ